jgi:acetolactate synthase-1/2/3 large subunit
MVNRKISEYLVDCLYHNGIDTYFLVTGGAIVPTVDAIGRKKGIKYYCFQHEQSAAMAAEAYYRTSGKMGVVLSTSGPGAQNLLNGICGCWYESIPCLFITGQVSTYESIDSIATNPRQLGFQEMPVVDSFAPFTKYSAKVNDATTFKDALNKAICLATEGRPGPCLLDLPTNIQNSIIESDLVEFTEPTKVVDDNLCSKVEVIKSKLTQSKRPLILIGHGVTIAKAQHKALQLLNKLNIPFVVSWGGFDAIPHDHPNFIGDIGVYGSRGGNFAIQNCDFLLSIGSRLDTRQTGGDLKTFSRESFKVMVDVDSNEIGKGRGLNIDLPVVCDAGIFLDECLVGLYSIHVADDWKGACSTWSKLALDNRPLKEDVLTSYEFLEHLNTQLPDKSVVIPDEGGHLVWSMQSLKAKNGQRIFSNFGNSSMGYGLPAAIGAAVGTDNLVVCIDGDGGFQMNIQELQTIKQYDLPVKIFIINNSCYGIIKQFQDAYFDSRYTATDNQDYTTPDFVAVATAYGIKAVEANKSNYKEIINLALNEKGSILVNVIIDRGQKLTPKLEFGNPLEDMSPYLTDEQIQQNMIVDMIPRRDNSQGWVTLNK